MTEVIRDCGAIARNRVTVVAPHYGYLQPQPQGHANLEESRPNMKVLMAIPKIRLACCLVESLVLRLATRIFYVGG